MNLRQFDQGLSRLEGVDKSIIFLSLPGFPSPGGKIGFPSHTCLLRMKRRYGQIECANNLGVLIRTTRREFFSCERVNPIRERFYYVYCLSYFHSTQRNGWY